ncbi:MAG: hypothetical protein EPO21_21010 [Chloroflexota bacterium]|nr:MAG: hypothetical protein EPO21_21010 [Chloroflexota bacterium]
MEPQRQNKRYVLFYGKGGVGKTTVATNLSVALARQGEHVLLVGCSPKSNVVDAYKTVEIDTILDLRRAEGLNEGNIGRAIHRTRDGVIITETGGPEPGIGCGGQGLTNALESLDRFQDAVEGLKDANYVIYDVIGDVVCGGFATPMRMGDGVKEVFVVTSGELMSLYAANNIVRAVAELVGAGETELKLGGLVANMRGTPREEEVLAEFSARVNVPIIATIPRAPRLFGEAEDAGGPLVEVMPDDEVAQLFTELATTVRNDALTIQARPFLDYNELFDMFMQFQKVETIHGDGVAATYLQRLPGEIVVRDRPRKISIYGTGGVGKSTVSSNLSAALVMFGERVYQVGCDPKRDSIATICGELRPTILDTARETGRVNRNVLKELVYQGRDYDNRLFGSECGGPTPGRGCAGKGVAMALRYLEQYHIIDDLAATFVIYDVLGDTVCGGFANPLRLTRSVYIVANGELATIVQAMKIAQSIQAVAHSGVEVGIAGVIDNMRGVPDERKIVETVFGEAGLPVIHHIPRSPYVQEAENLKRTVVQTFPDSEQAAEYVSLARKVLENDRVVVPDKPLPNSRRIKELIASVKSAVAR